jgi:proteasome accessory factor B
MYDKYSLFIVAIIAIYAATMVSWNFFRPNNTQDLTHKQFEILRQSDQFLSSTDNVAFKSITTSNLTLNTTHGNRLLGVNGAFQVVPIDLRIDLDKDSIQYNSIDLKESLSIGDTTLSFSTKDPTLRIEHSSSSPFIFLKSFATELRNTSMLTLTTETQIDPLNGCFVNLMCNQASTYRIRKDSFSWPIDVKLTSRQLALLNLAAEAWAGGSLSTEASRGITKLRGLGVVGQSSDILGISPKIHTIEPSFKDIDFAIAENQVIQFDYRNPKTSEIQTRTLQPWMMRQIAGAWLVLGFDEDRKAARNFMLRRIVSKIQIATVGKETRTFEMPDKQVIDAAVSDLDEHAKNNLAVLKVTKGSEAWFRYELDLVKGNQDGLLKINYHDLYVLAEQLREYADQIEVIEPEELTSLVQLGFRRVADLHA